MNLRKLNIIIVLLSFAICFGACGSNTNNEQYPIADIENNLSEKKEKDDAHTFWIDGKEFKVLEYIDEKSMLVKFELEDCIIQMIVPRSLENEVYIMNYEIDIWNDLVHPIIGFLNKDKQDLFLCSIITNVNTKDLFIEAYSNDLEHKQEYEIQDNGNRIVVYEATREVFLSEPYNELRMGGYLTYYYDDEANAMIAAAILNTDESEQESGKNYLESIQIRESNDEDFVSRIESQTDDYEQRMLNMYAKYVELLDNPTTYLQEKHNAVGELYEMHYLYDFTEDGIPEIIFMGSPNWICIIGENSSQNISGSDIAWSKTPAEFYVRIEWTGEVTWQKYQIETDQNGIITANMIDTKYLCSSYNYENDEFTYTYQGRIISEKEFLEKEKSLKAVDIPAPWRYDLDGYVASEKAFYRSVTYLNDKRIDEE